METELKLQLQASNNSSLYPASRLTSLIQNSYKSATTLFKWLALARAKTTSTTAKGAGDDVCYYDYPDEFRTNTIFRVQIDGDEYNRKSFESFLDYRNRYPTGNEKEYLQTIRDLFSFLRILRLALITWIFGGLYRLRNYLYPVRKPYFPEIQTTQIWQLSGLLLL